MKFMYSTLNSIRKFGVSPRSVTDDKAHTLIEFYSKMCNRMIEKYFIPVNDISRFHGKCNRLLRISGKSNLIRINSLTIINSDASRTLIDRSKYTYQGNTIMCNHSLPAGFNNIEINAVYGVIENHKEIEVKTLSDIKENTAFIELNNVQGLSRRDVLTFGSVVIIINDISYEDNIVFIDEYKDNKIITAGSTTTCYGAVPMEIERAINLLVQHSKALESQVGGRIKKEKTDAYEYEMFSNQFYSTGVPEVDSIFQSFSDSDFILEYL